MNCFWERAATKQNFKKLKELVEYHWNVESWAKKILKKIGGKNYHTKMELEDTQGRETLWIT